MNELVPIQKKYKFQDHGLNIFFYTKPIEYKILSVDNIGEIQDVEGRLIYIPYSLMLVDAFYNGVLTPMRAMLPVTDNDADSMLAWTAVNAVSDRHSKPPNMSVAVSISLTCMLTAVAREIISDLDPQIIGSIEKEKANFIGKFLTGEEIDEDEVKNRDTVIMLVAEYVDKFFHECIAPLVNSEPYVDVEYLYSTIYSYYSAFVRSLAERVNEVYFHPEVMESL